MIRKILQAILAIGLLIYGYFFLSGSDLQPEFIGAGVIGLLTLLALLVESIITNRKRLGLIIYCKWLSLKKQRIRFSMSYLYRIKVDDKYLLVKNSNFPHYQLVGGKYKILDGTRSFLQKEFDAIDDPKLPNKDLMKDDFALFIPAGKAIKFLDWFNQGEDREISHWREFYEELIEGKAKLLDKEKFPYINYNFKGRVRTPVKRTPGWDCYEILQYDILDIIPTPEQRQELRKLQEKGDKKYHKWADTELIQCLGHDNREKKQVYDIGIHTKWAVNMKWSKE
ncbi:SMODS-associated NUDIX domain-containing protein [Aquimarina rubra]|uniref:CD-NTase-associated protein 16 NUDIX domain-containing protein n=1 Tax=Aquimarina rubra TaxID=1920033 RepID=A0ABW5LGJ3_9FLAO